MLKKAIFGALFIPMASMSGPFKLFWNTLTHSEKQNDIVDNYDAIDPAQSAKKLPHIVAVWQGKDQTVDKMLQQHPDLVNAKDIFGNTALSAAASHNKIRILATLLNNFKDIQINTIDNQGLTPLHWACIAGNHEGAKILLERGADPNIQDLSGQTPLHYSCLIKDELLIQLLARKQANPNILNNSKKSPLDEAIKQEVSFTTIMQLLTPETYNNVTAQKAALAGHLDLFEYLWIQTIRPNNEFILPALPPTTCTKKKARWDKIKTMLNFCKNYASY